MEASPHTGSQGRGIKFWAVVTLAVLAVIFILLNSQEVEIKFIVGTVNAPLIIALTIATVLGLIIGYLAAVLRRGDRSSD